MPNSLTSPGQFLIGANYWASHAGMHMWSDWQPAVVEADLKQLSQIGLQILRVFPLWPVFQPFTQLYGGGGAPQEMRFGEEPLIPLTSPQSSTSKSPRLRIRFGSSCPPFGALPRSVKPLPDLHQPG